MWRFIAGASPSAKVQRTSKQEETTAKTAATASQRKCCSRKLVADNGEPRQWLKYVDGTMYCEVCRNIVKDKRWNNSFVVVTQVMKLEAIKDHETSNCHKDCMAIKAAWSSSVQTSRRCRCSSETPMPSASTPSPSRTSFGCAGKLILYFSKCDTIQLT